MNKFRTHKCNELRKEKVGNEVTLSGWINKKRDHGNLLFIDLRDNYGITQCIIDKENSNFKMLEKTQLETVIKIVGKVVERSKESVNSDIETGEIEVVIKNFQVLGECKELPLPVFTVSKEKTSKLCSTIISLSPSCLSITALPVCKVTSPIDAKLLLTFIAKIVRVKSMSPIVKRNICI